MSAVALTVGAGGLHAWQFATVDKWVGVVLIGVTLPVTVLYEWTWLRRRSDEAMYVADRTLLMAAIALLAGAA